jgi:hypothetical protein
MMKAALRILLFMLLLLPLVVRSQSVNCSICEAGGAAAPQDLTAVFQFGDSVTTCGDAYTLGSVLLSEDDCIVLQSVGDSLCLCTLSADEVAPLVSCDLCADGSAPNDLSAIGNFGEITTTCGDVYNNGPVILPEANCTFLQGIGSSLCSCNKELPGVNNCTLCEDGSVVPRVLLESFPGETCAAMQNEARRDEEENCVHYQAVVGHYCGCVNPDATDDACRICGSNDLPAPQLLVNNVDGNMNVSCIELEFNANVDGTCGAAQNAYSKVCCPTLAPVAAPTSSGRRLFGLLTSQKLFMIVAACGALFM